VKKISVYSLIGEHCVSLEDGRRLYKDFFPDLKNGDEVELDFAGVQVFAASFFNSSLGFLLRDFEPADLNRLVRILNLAPAASAVLDRVIKNSRRYYQEEMLGIKPGNPLLRGVNLGEKRKGGGHDVEGSQWR